MENGHVLLVLVPHCLAHFFAFVLRNFCAAFFSEVSHEKLFS